MELDRRYITRRDFPAARRGYDPDEVDTHLRELADAVEDLRRRADRPAETSVAGAAADQVRIIVDAAERSAAEIEQHAEEDARTTRTAAEVDARDTRDRADAEAAEHIRRVEEATRSMVDRAGAAESQVEQLIDNLRSTTDRVIEGLRTGADGMVSDLRTGAQGIGRELEEIRRGLGDVRDARDQPAPDLEPEYRRPEPEDGSLKRQGDELHPGDVHPVQADPYPTEEALPPAPEREPFVPEPMPEPEPEPMPEPVMDVGPPDAEPEVVRDTRETVEEAALGGGGASSGGSEGARLIALNMALNGSPREETAAYLAENFNLPDQDALLDEVYSRAGG